MATMLKTQISDKEPSIMEFYQSWGSVIKNKDDIRGYSIYFNPYYEQEDPFKKLFWQVGVNSVGGKGYVRNPFTMGHDMEYGYEQTTAEKLFYSQLNPGNIDPYFQHTFLMQKYDH